ncbi:AT-hook motif nuclear-localized protein 1-like [Impatiens glandulifera]|uniref:AT-hook motif nuclear-localized protein 1-like n=1 Tax=Impatiens glandulifera TaxID=253017 RepID=UPI001FB0F48D|nr:AT-hook motif nuclear-localized protein 1-like [Impatiens glandulifera]
MEAREGIKISGVTVVTSDAPSDYHLAPRSENPTPTTGSAPAGTPQVSITPAPAPPAASWALVPLKKKRGRPRKYGPDGSVNTAISPKPISSSAPPPVIDFSTGKKGKIRGVGSSLKLQHQHQQQQQHQHHQQQQQNTVVNNNSNNNLGEWVSCSVGANFTPHIITVNAGEDVTMKVISFSQQGPRAICILSANGVISSVTLRQPDSSGGTLTYEGRFEILSLTGSFMPSEINGGGIRNRTGGMSVSLASPDGRVVGGGVAGLLVAASPVQIVVGSFVSGNQVEPTKVKKQKTDSSPVVITATPAAAAAPVVAVERDVEGVAGYGGGGGHRVVMEKPNWGSTGADSRTDINVSLSG